MNLSEYLEENYNKIQQYARNISPGDYHDLTHEVILQLYETKEGKLAPLIESGAIRFWIIRMLINNYHSTSSKYHYKWRKPEQKHRELARYIKEWSDPGDYEFKEKRLEAIEKAIEESPWFDAVVFSIYFEEGHSLNTLAKKTGISRHTLYSTIRRTQDGIKEKIKRAR